MFSYSGPTIAPKINWFCDEIHWHKILTIFSKINTYSNREKNKASESVTWIISLSAFKLLQSYKFVIFKGLALGRNKKIFFPENYTYKVDLEFPQPRIF